MKWWQKAEQGMKPWHKGTHLIVLSESFQVDSHMTWLTFTMVALVVPFQNYIQKTGTSTQINLLTLNYAVGGSGQYKMMQKPLKNDRNPGTWVLIWENSVRAIQWIPTWQGSNGLQISLLPCPLDESSLSIGRVKMIFVIFCILVNRKSDLSII